MEGGVRVCGGWGEGVWGGGVRVCGGWGEGVWRVE